MSLKIGIDLGTSNSVVSRYKDNGEVEVLVNLDGDKLTPSVVYYDGGKFTVGKKALSQLKVGSPNAVGSFKVDMGSVATHTLSGREFTPKELSAEVLRYLKRSAEEITGETVTECVITVPAYFTEIQRKDTREAGELAGLPVSRIINEPTSAALAYGINLEEEQTMLVYDLGGGTFDVSLLTAGDGTVEVISVRGDNHLGGDTFDNQLALIILKSLKKLIKYIPGNDNVIKVVNEIAKHTKETLSTQDEVEIDLTVLKKVDKNFKGLDEPLVITKEQFRKLISNNIKRTIQITIETLQSADMDLSDVDKVILVGGSTRIPIVKEELEKYLKIPVMTNAVNPDLIVSVGAAIQTSILTGDNKDMVLLDVTPFNLSIEKADGTCSVLIKSNSGIPISNSRVYTTNRDNQEEIEINITQGNKLMAKENEFLGRMVLTDLPKAPKGVPQIEVKFKLNENGELEVTATEVMSGKTMTIKRELKS